MKKLLATLALTLALTGAAQAETRNLQDFTSVEARGRIRVEVVVADHYAIEIDGADSGRIAAYVEDGELRIAPAGRIWFSNGPEYDAQVRVVTPQLNSLQAFRGVYMSGRNIQGGALALEASTGALLEASGQCERLQAKATTGGSIDANALQCAHVDADASTGGALAVHAREGIVASAWTGGAIAVHGAPASREINQALGATITID